MYSFDKLKLLKKDVSFLKTESTALIDSMGNEEKMKNQADAIKKEYDDLDNMIKDVMRLRISERIKESKK